MTRPRVLHIYKDYWPPVMGGIESTINLLAKGTKDEFDVTVLVNGEHGASTVVEENIDGVRVVRTGELFRMSSAPFSTVMPRVLRELGAEADVLHFHHPNPTGDIAYLLVQPQVPIVMTYHSDVVRQRFSKWLYGPVQESMMRATKVIMPTSANYLESSKWLRRYANKCRVVPLGIDLSGFRKTPEVEERAKQIRQQYVPPIILFVGKLRYYKGLEYLVEAMQHVDATLLMIGSGPEYPRLRELAKLRNVTPRSQFLGELSDEEKVAHMYAADVFCLPSHLRSEAFGLSQVEAMACGLPVVSTDIFTGVSYVNQNNVTGLTVLPGSAPALAAGLNTLVSNESLRHELGAAARHRAYSMFSAERMCRDVKEVYYSVMTKK